MNRRVFLFGYALLVCVTQVLWVTFSPITTLAAEAMHTGVGLVGDLAALFPIVYIIAAIPSGIWLDRHFAAALGIGAVLTGLAGISRVLYPVDYSWQFAMQLLLAVGQPFVINAMAAFARRYFSVGRRPLAITTASVGLFAGIVIAMIVSPPLANRGGLRLVELVEGFPAAIVMLWVLLGLAGPLRVPVWQVLPNELGAVSSPPPFFRFVLASLRGILKDKFIWLLCGLLAIGLGVFDALNTWLQPVLAEYGMGGASGGLLALMTIAGILGSAVLPSYAAVRNRRKLVLVLAVGLATWLFIAIMLWQSVVWIGIWMVLAGFFLLAGFPVIVEWAGHHVKPGLQGAAVGFIMLTSHTGGIILIFVIQMALKPPYLALSILAAATAVGLWLTLLLPGGRAQEGQVWSFGKNL